jgi:hypothetical protein
MYIYMYIYICIYTCPFLVFNKNALGMLENVSHTVLLRACITCAYLLHVLEIDTKFFNHAYWHLLTKKIPDWSQFWNEGPTLYNMEPCITVMSHESCGISSNQVYIYIEYIGIYIYIHICTICIYSIYVIYSIVHLVSSRENSMEFATCHVFFSLGLYGEGSLW